MNLYLRLMRTIVAAWFARRIHHLSPIRSRFRVWPLDLDAFGHMNNGRYLQIMDVARVQWMLQTGVASAIRRNRWAPLLGGGFIRFRRALRIGAAYHVQTRLLGWDAQWFFLEHTFIDDENRTVAVGISRAALRRRGAWVPTSEVANAVNPDATAPALPDYVTAWLNIEDAMYENGVRAQHGLLDELPLKEAI